MFKSQSYLKQSRHLVLLVLVAGIALLLMAPLFDVQVFATLSNWPEMERSFFAALTRWGKSDWILFPSLIAGLVGSVVLLFKLPYTIKWFFRAVTATGWYIFVGVGLPGLVVAILKRLIGRARPLTPEQPEVWLFMPVNWNWQWQSFPSGHTTTSFAFAVILTSLLGKRFALPLFLLAALIGMSRIAVEAHYATDVIAGAVLGTVLAILVRNCFAQRGLPIHTRNTHIKNRAGPLLRKGLYRLLSKA